MTDLMTTASDDVKASSSMPDQFLKILTYTLPQSNIFINRIFKLPKACSLSLVLLQ